MTTDGSINRFFDMSAGHPVPTTLTYREGNFHVGNLGGFPIARGTQQVMQITSTGRSSVFAAGFTAIVGIAFDQQGRLYVLETLTIDRDGPQPEAGRVVRVSSSGAVEDVATGLSFPTGMTFGSDGMLYVSHLGYGSEPGKGEVRRVRALPITESAL